VPGAAANPAWLHADAACVVAIKPAGLLSVPGRSIADCHWARLQCAFADLRIVHRLDMATSGLIVYARGAEPQRRLSRAFAERAVSKAYVAVVDGLVADEAGEIDLPLQADWPNRPLQKVDRAHGRPALTRYRVLLRSPEERTTRVALEPVTGRSHQLRVHLAALGHPILGDALYAPGAVGARSGRLLLHAAGLAFAHPESGSTMAFQAPAPF
jgi:tRNA pseudouridine32 synthase/23S rRNA pseudouridine746 synthase